MIHDPDVGRRVIQCACERAIAWHGPEHAAAQGWRGRYVRGPRGDLRRAWRCPECEAAARPQRQPREPGASTFRMPMPSLDTAMTQPARALALLDEHLETDPEAVAAFFHEIFQGRWQFLPHVLRFWETRARARGIEPPVFPKRRCRRKARQDAEVT